MVLKYSKKYQKHQKEIKESLKRVKEKFFAAISGNFHRKSNYEVIFSFEFLKLLTEALPSPLEFLSMTMKERREVARTIQNLLLVESNWKGLVSKMYNEHRLVQKMFPKQLSKFTRDHQEYFFPPEHMTNKQQREAYPSYKTIAFCKGLFKFMQDKKIPFFKDFSFDSVDDSKLNLIAIEISENINSGYFFKEIVKICMKKAVDNRINEKIAPDDFGLEESVGNPFLFVKRTHIMYPIQKAVVLYLCVALIEGLKKKVPSLKVEVDEKVLLFFDDFFKNHEGSLMQEAVWYRDTFNISLFFISLFVESGMVLKEDRTKTDKNDKHETIIYWLVHDMTNTVPFSHHLPRIMPPTKFDTKTNIEAFVSPFLRGKLSISASKITLKALSLAQGKAFKVNEYALEFFDKIHNSVDFLPKITSGKVLEDGNASFPTVVDFVHKFNTYMNTKRSLSVNALQNYFSQEAFKHLFSSSIEKSKKIARKISLSIAGVTQVESEQYFKKRSVLVDFLTAKSKRQMMQTSLILAEIFKGFPIYFGTKLDFRGRMYPWEYFLSRTTGGLKQLLCDFHAEKLTTDGLINLMSAYYNFSLEFSVKWHEFLRVGAFSTDSIWERAKEFFDEHNFEKNPEMFSCDDNAAYVLTLHVNLLDALCNKNRSVSVWVEIDQVASGVMLLAILLGIRSLAERSNVLGSEPKDVYRYLMWHMREFFYEHIRDPEMLDENERQEYDKLVSFLCTDRKCTKDVLMRWVYSQASYNRRILISDSLQKHYNRNLSDFELDLVQKFANKYDDFLESLFPGIKKQKSFFTQVLDIRLKSGINIKGMNIRTMDETGLSWGVEIVESITKGVWDPISLKSYNVKIKFKGKDKEKNTETKSNFPSKTQLKEQRDQYHRGLFPNLIHSIDGALMRLIIYRVWEKSGYVINHLHDCILCHPNLVQTVYEVITEIYTDGTFDNLANRVYFGPMQEGLSGDDKKAIQKIAMEFCEGYDPLNITSESFVAENSYTFEGSVKRDILYEKMREKGLEPASSLNLLYY